MATAKQTEELAAQIDAIRADMQNLTSTVSRIANTQMGRAQDKAVETAQEAEEAIKRNPLQAVAIAACRFSSNRATGGPRPPSR